MAMMNFGDIIDSGSMNERKPPQRLGIVVKDYGKVLQCTDGEGRFWSVAKDDEVEVVSHMEVPQSTNWKDRIELSPALKLMRCEHDMMYAALTDIAQWYPHGSRIDEYLEYIRLIAQWGLGKLDSRPSPQDFGLEDENLDESLQSPVHGMICKECEDDGYKGTLVYIEAEYAPLRQYDKGIHTIVYRCKRGHKWARNVAK